MESTVPPYLAGRSWCFRGKMALLSAKNIVKIAELKIMAAISGAYITAKCPKEERKFPPDMSAKKI